ncbi:MAG: type IIA DNA topoisomerase subunit B [Spirochaetales bacterium]
MAKTYNSKDIVVLEGLDAVRMRPGMYIGTTGVKGLHHLLWEIVDNSVDEIANGYGNKITVTLHQDGSASVRDNGRGIPTDIHPKLKVSGVEVVFTQLHAGGKFESSTYNYSGGLHGVGASVTNALSKWLKVMVEKDGRQYFMEFESIEDEQGKIRSGVPKAPLKEIGVSDNTGSYVHFMPDYKIFKDVTFSIETISQKLKELAFLNKGLEIVLIDERSVNINNKPFVRRYKYNGGLVDFVQYLNESKTVLYDRPLYLEGRTDKIEVELAMQHTDLYIPSIFSYVNNIPTTEGGTHETGFKSAITKVFNDVARKQGYLKEKDENFLGEDFREGMTAVLTVKMRGVEFEGQTKTKLGNPEAKTEVEAIIGEEIEKLIQKNENKNIFETIVKKAKQAQKTRLAEKRAKTLARQQNSLDGINLVGKLSGCSGRKAELNELFIVEGDSAGGSTKQGRDRRFQAILPLRGKPLNVEKKRLDQVLENEEMRMIISAIGAGVGDTFDVSNIKYHKVIILADADQDGGHIKSLVLTFFFRYMKEMITEGHLYIGMPPLYKVYNKNNIEYAYADYDLNEAKEKIGKGYQIQRYKGLGEMNPEQLWETTLDPKRRHLVKVNIDDAAEAERIITTLMGNSIDLRKSYISKYANFNKEDKFIDLMGE